MKYYGILKNDLNEWITFTRADSREQVRKTMNMLSDCGFPLERIKIVKALEPDCHVSFNHIELTQSDGNIIRKQLHSTNFKQDFLAYVQMAMTGQLKDVIKVELQDPAGHALFTWEDNRLELINRKESPEELFRFLDDIRNPHYDWKKINMALK